MDIVNESIWLPYIRFNDFGEPIEISENLKILSDTSQTWHDLNLKRPEWFDIFRQFPTIKKGNFLDAEPCSGSLITASGSLCKDRWLSHHAAQLIAILYFIGDKAVGYGMKNYAGSPKELFTHLPFSGNYPGVSFSTKYGWAIEESISMAITPPLSLWIGKGVSYKINLKHSVYAKLLDILFTDPDNHIITSCMYYFYAQSGEIFNNNPYMDTVYFCGALESAYNITEKGKRKEILVDYLMNEYCPKFSSNTTQMVQRYKEFFNGLYDYRSIGAHGVRIPEITLNAPDRAAYRNFNKLKGRFSIIRAITRDVIIRDVMNLDSCALCDFLYDDDAGDLLHASLYSYDIWTRIKHYAKMKKSISTIAGFDGNAFAPSDIETREFCSRFLLDFLEDVPDIEEIKECYAVYAHALFMRATNIDKRISIQRSDVDLNDENSIISHIDKIEKYHSDPVIRRLRCIVEKFMQIIRLHGFFTQK